jgi:ribosomal protein S18 acetylase RimI-like enzyme
MPVEQSSGKLPSQLSIERLRNLYEIGEAERRKIGSDRTAKVCDRLIAERFRKGASLWLARWDGDLAGYGWSLSCGSMEGCYYPADPEDVHLLEFLVFPEYRGQRINSLLVNHILRHLAAEGRVHAYLDVAEWNQAGLNSYRRTSFRPVGISKGGPLRRRRIVKWIDPEGVYGQPPGQNVAVRTRPA